MFVIAINLVYGFGGFLNGQLAPLEMPDRNFAVCRIMYQSVRSEPSGAGWQTDYPYGEMNLTIRVSELTRTRVSRGADGQPNNWVVRLTDDSLFNCPYTVASDVGTIGLNSVEAERLRTYLLKGGFLWVDDFWGEAAWAHWTQQIAKALPPSEFPIEDVPLTDPIFSSQFTIKKVPQVPRYSIGVGMIAEAPRVATFSVQARFVGAQYEDDLNELVLDEYAVMDASATRSLARSVQLFLGVENLFDVDYDVARTPVRSIGWPLTVRAGVRLFLP